MRTHKEPICVIRNKRSGWVTAYHSAKELYRDFMDRDLSRDYVNEFEGWYSYDFVKDCWRKKNRDIGFVYPKDVDNKRPMDFYNVNDACKMNLPSYGIFDIDSRNKLVIVYEIHGELWKSIN